MSDVDDVKPAPPAETTEVVAPVDVPVAVVERTAVVEQAPVAVPDYTTLRTGEVVAPLPAIRRPHVSLFLISFFILFFELACIRWFGSMVVFLTFFTNIVLLACFLGMSVGLLTAQRRANFITWVLPLTLLAAVLAAGTYWAYQYNLYGDKVTIAVGNQRSPQLIYFGTEYRTAKVQVPMFVFAGVFFTLIALMFIGLGQTMGRCFDAIPNRVAAYTTDVLGSLTGIVVFGALSFYRTNPHVWFGIAVLLCVYFLPRVTRWQLFCQLALLLIVGATAYGAFEKGGYKHDQEAVLRWSPYYKVKYTPATGDIDTNNIAHQQMLNVKEAGPAYALPHLLNRDAGNAPFHDVLIIGAGSGNDVAAALAYGDENTHVDAVEIDPVINLTGWNYHPNHPYNDPRVTVHWDDGRSFLRGGSWKYLAGKIKADKKYDLVIYALVDSLVLHSGYSSIRLESFLFTEQSFEDIRSRLKPGGTFIMYNYFRQGWVVGRLFNMAKEKFGAEPVAISMPYQEKIDLNKEQFDHITYFMCGDKENAVVNSVRRNFGEKGSFWVHERPAFNEKVNAFAPTPPPVIGTADSYWRKIAPAVVDFEGSDAAGVSAAKTLPTDNWPFLYLKSHTIPTDPSVYGMVTIAAISVVILMVFAPGTAAGLVAFRRERRPNAQMFFLGAGFMLLETKGVVHMALLFGATWIVNSVVFFAILLMILVSNLFVLTVKPRRLLPYYVLLVAALAVNALVPMTWFLKFALPVRIGASCAVVFLPIFFAGVIFATVFRDSTQPDVDFGSNVAGIILGGLSEYFSLVLGFNYLLLIAIGFYVLSGVLRPRRRAPEVLATTTEPVAVAAT